MMRGPIGGGGHQQQGSNNNNTHNSNNNNSNAQMHSSGGFHGPGNRSMGQRLLSMGSASPTIGHKRDISGFSVMGGSGGGPNFHHGSPRQAAASPGYKFFEPYAHLLGFNIGSMHLLIYVVVYFELLP